jgi:hypothetical protein
VPRTFSGGLQGALSPDPDQPGQLFVPPIVDGELVPPKPGEVSGHLREDVRIEAAVLLYGELQKVVQTVPVLHGHEVHEVAGLSSTEYGQQLVDGQLLPGQHRVAGSLLDREEPRIGCQVQLRPVGGVRDRQPGEAVAVDDPFDLKVGIAECLFDGWDQLIDRQAAEPEEVQSRVPRSISPRAMSAAPPARAKPSASGRPATILAIRCWSGLSTQVRPRGGVGTSRPTPGGRSGAGRGRRRSPGAL